MTAVLELDPTLDRPAWLAFRREHLGASDMAGLLGISPWSSPWSVWADKVGLLPEEPDSEVMEAGRWLERAIAPWFAARTDLWVMGEQAVHVHPTDRIASCTADGAVTAGPAGDPLGGLEIKTQGPGRRWERIPEHFQAQGQWAMYVCGWERMWFAVLMGRRLDIHELERDHADIDFMAERAHRFWHDHVEALVPPPVDGHDATLRALAAVYPKETPETSIEIDGLVEVLDEWRQSKRDKKVAEAREKAAAAQIQAVLGEAEEGTVAGERVVSWRSQTRKSYVVAESTFRVLRPHTPKEQAS